MFTTFALIASVLRVQSGHAGLATARVMPMTVPQTARRRPPSRRRLNCTWVLDAGTSRPTCRWTAELSDDADQVALPAFGSSPQPGDRAPWRRLSAA